MARDADPQHAWLYVSSYLGFGQGRGQQNAVSIFDVEKPGTPLIGRITSGLNAPTGIALDAEGNLYVPNYYGGDVTIYAPRAKEPSLTLSERLNDPASVATLGLQGILESSGVAVDALNGNLFVANLDSGNGGGSAVNVYPSGSLNPTYKLPNTPFADFLGVGTIHRTEYLIVPNSQSNTVTFFKHDPRSSVCTRASS
jgi:DNA-binding beta-propeller fold protein YncE